MANIWEPSEEQREAWAQWVRSRPSAVQAVAERLVPWKLYRMKSTGHRVTLVSFEENVGGRITVKVNVSGEYNLVTFPRQVFGIDPGDLVECELPGADEPVGSMCQTDAEVEELIDGVRVVREDYRRERN